MHKQSQQTGQSKSKPRTRSHSAKEEEEEYQQKLLNKLGNKLGSDIDNLMQLVPQATHDDTDDQENPNERNRGSNDAAEVDNEASKARDHVATKNTAQTQSTSDDVKRLVKRCMNALGSANIDATVSKLATAMQIHGVHLVLDTLCTEVPRCLDAGPRQGSSFIASLGTATACCVSVTGDSNCAALLLACVVGTLQRARSKEDSATSYNCVCLLSVLFEARLVGPTLVWDIADSFVQSLSETDVAQLLLLVRACGPTLREHDPGGFKAFLERLSQKVGQLKADNQLPTRARLLLDLLIDIKNNKWRGRGAGNVVPSLSEAQKKLVSRLNVHSSVGADVSTARLQPLLSCFENEAQATRRRNSSTRRNWWEESGDAASGSGLQSDYMNRRSASDAGGTHSDLMRKAIGARDEHDEQLERFAEQQRLSAGSRRLVFKAVAGAEDYAHAAERLQKLKLGKTGEGEAIRAIVELCAQERRYNKFYELLLSHLATNFRPKSTRRSVAYAFEDIWRNLHKESSKRRALHTGRLCGSLIGRRSLGVITLKAAKLADPSLPTLADEHFHELITALLKRSGSEQNAQTIGQQASRNDKLRCDLSAFVSARVLPYGPSASAPYHKQHHPASSSDAVAAKAQALLRGLEAGLTQ